MLLVILKLYQPLLTCKLSGPIDRFVSLAQVRENKGTIIFPLVVRENLSLEPRTLKRTSKTKQNKTKQVPLYLREVPRNVFGT